MKMYKLSCLIVVLTIALSGPILGIAGAQERQVPANNDVTHEKANPFLAVILTTFNIPFRGLLCVSDVGMGTIIMGASAGRRYSQAADAIEQGCAGPWVLTPRRIREEQLKVEELRGAAFTDYNQW